MSDNHNVNYLEAKKGLWSWLFTLDHKRIGIMYLASIVAAFAIGGFFALMVRMELFTAQPDFFAFIHSIFGTGEEKEFLGSTQPGTTYNKFFTLHGAAMVFLFIIPSIPAAFGNFVLPLMLGAKDVAFPRLNLLSFWIYAVGTAIFLSSLVFGGVDTGWTFYAPYSIQETPAVPMVVAAVFIMGFSSILTGLNFIVTIHAMRPKQMKWFRMPLMLWALYATSAIQIMATPVLAITLALLGMEHIYGVGIFDPALGGDPVLFQHFFWFYSHPAVYIMILPAMGVMSELISTFSKKPVFGYTFVAYSSMAIAAVSFIVWGHHMFVSGQSEFSTLMFSLLTFLVGIPSAVKVFNWVATLYKGAISFETPMLYALSFIILFTIGGLTGLLCATLSIDIHIHDTYYIVAHFHYVMMGGTVMAFLGALHYWWPKMFGRMYNEALGQIVAVAVFIGFNLTFIPQFIMGSKGMPRRYHEYVPEFTVYHQLSSIGALFLGISFLTMLVYLLFSLFSGRKASQNPWGASTVEWQTATPPVEHNFVGAPVIPEEPYVYTKIGASS